MKVIMDKYCIIADNKYVEVGCARNYDFIPLAELEKSRSKINLFHSFNKAKTSFERSWSGIEWNEKEKCFTANWGRFKKFEIKKVKITYEVESE